MDLVRKLSVLKESITLTDSSLFSLFLHFTLLFSRNQNAFPFQIEDHTIMVLMLVVPLNSNFYGLFFVNIILNRMKLFIYSHAHAIQIFIYFDTDLSLFL